jgi:hypothetical protein
VISTTAYLGTTPVAVDDLSANCSYTTWSPCPATPSNPQLAIDTTKVPDGTYQLALRTNDAAGNTTQVVSSQAIQVHNSGDVVPTAGPAPVPAPAPPSAAGPDSGRGQHNGSGTNDRAVITAALSSDKRELTVPYGKTTKITGHLAEPGGNPIAGATLRIASRTKLAGAIAAAAGAAVTDAAGNWSYEAPVGSSRGIQISWRAFSNDTDFAASTDVNLLVTAGVTLKARPKRLRNGRRVRLLGQLLGGPIPRSGVLVTVEGRPKVKRGRWQTFAAVHTDGDGAFVAKHRFRTVTRGRVKFQFRALIKAQDAYPYVAGKSNTARALVRGR